MNKIIILVGIIILILGLLSGCTEEKDEDNNSYENDVGPEIQVLLSSLTKPEPPQGINYDYIVECADGESLIYGAVNGDTGLPRFLMQSMNNDRMMLTGFGILLMRHGTPDKNLKIGIWDGGTPTVENAYNPDTWLKYGEVSPDLLPEDDTPYWIYCSFPDAPINTTTFHAHIIATSEANYIDSYWAWFRCSGVPSGDASGFCCTHVLGWYGLPDTLSYFSWTK